MIFQDSRGCVFTPSGAGGGGGWYKLAGLSSSASAPILIVGAQTTDSDIIMPVTALGGIKICYTAGKAFGNVQITGAVLAGSSSTNGAAVNTVLEYFEKNRVSVSKTSVNLSVPGGRGYKIYLHGLGLAEPDAQYNVQPFILHALLAEAGA